VKDDLTIRRSTAGNEFFVAIKTEEDWDDDLTNSENSHFVPRILNLTLTAETESGEYTDF